jgi:RNA binding exosome subunit
MKKAGIWLDQKEAKVITLADDSEEIKTIYSQIETRERIPGESKIYGRFGKQYLSDEKTREIKIDAQLKRYLNEVIETLEDKDELMIFGPGKTKKELEKLIRDHPKMYARLKEIRIAKQMTENQKVAYVKDFFAN